MRCEGLESRNLFAHSVGLDTGFNGGVVETSFGGDYQDANTAFVAKDGRLFVTGFIDTDGAHGTVTRQIFVGAYDKNGSLSAAFGKGGKLVLTATDTTRIGAGTYLDQAPRP